MSERAGEPGEVPHQPPPGAATEAAFDSASIEALQQAKSTQEASDDEFERQLRKARADAASQANRLRGYFATWIAALVTSCVLAGIAVIGLYIGSQWGRLEAPVLIAWFTAQLVQVIGLAFIVAEYLFPRPSRSAKDR